MMAMRRATIRESTKATIAVPMPMPTARPGRSQARSGFDQVEGPKAPIAKMSMKATSIDIMIEAGIGSIAKERSGTPSMASPPPKAPLPIETAKTVISPTQRNQGSIAMRAFCSDKPLRGKLRRMPGARTRKTFLQALELDRLEQGGARRAHASTRLEAHDPRSRLRHQCGTELRPRA